MTPGTDKIGDDLCGSPSRDLQTNVQPAMKLKATNFGHVRHEPILQMQADAEMCVL